MQPDSKLIITNRKGKEVEVTDPPLALMQADDFRHYRVSNPTAADVERYAYWEDLYQKLLTL